ncbi:MAG TPA: 3'-5' exonuclease, partial [Burkholderiales bacterium]|nr:3'-5' exonuclease [Burkholderiales bacterium]
MTPVLAFDIETVPDCAGIRRLHDLPDSLSDA